MTATGTNTRSPGLVLEKRLVDRDNTFGTGDPRGVAAPEAGNNAAAGGALVPMLTLGVPGSGTTAVLLAMLMSLNITPGPLLFTQHPEVVWGLIASLYLGNIVLLVLNLPLVGIFARMLAVPPWILMPGVVMISYVGIYSINDSTCDLLLITGFDLTGIDGLVVEGDVMWTDRPIKLAGVVADGRLMVRDDAR